MEEDNEVVAADTEDLEEELDALEGREGREWDKMGVGVGGRAGCLTDRAHGGPPRVALVRRQVPACAWRALLKPCLPAHPRRGKALNPPPPQTHTHTHTNTHTHTPARRCLDSRRRPVPPLCSPPPRREQGVWPP